MALRKLITPPHSHYPDLHLGYRQTSDGTWYVEWRRTVYSRKPVVIRRAWDTEIELIQRIKALEAQISNPLAPRPVQHLKLKPYPFQNAKPTTNAEPPQLRPEAPSKLELQRPADAPAVGRPAHNGRTDGGNGPRR